MIHSSAPVPKDSHSTTTTITIITTMRSNYKQSFTEELLTADAIDVVRVRSSDSTEPVHTTGKAVTTMPMTPPRAVVDQQQQRSPAPATPHNLTTPPRVSSYSPQAATSPWRFKDDTASIFRSPSFSPPSILRSSDTISTTNHNNSVDFWSIQRSMAFDEDDAEF